MIPVHYKYATISIRFYFLDETFNSLVQIYQSSQYDCDLFTMFPDKPHKPSCLQGSADQQ